jgi:hypothetical protein
LDQTGQGLQARFLGNSFTTRIALTNALSGTCLLTLGTDAKRPEESDRNDEAYLVEHQLLESHCYAVLGERNFNSIERCSLNQI